MKKMRNLFNGIFVCLGLAVLLAGCPDAMGTIQETAAGMGRVIVSVVETGERTILPLTPVFSKFEFTFEPLDGQPGHNKLTIKVGTGANAPVELAAGRWNIIAKGFVTISGIEGIADGDYRAAEGRQDNVTINAGQTKSVSIDLKGGVQTDEKGVLNWDISLPNNAISAVMVIRTIEGTIIKDVNLKAQNQGNTALDSGYYFVTLTLNDQLSKTEILHIYGGMTSRVEQAFDKNALYFNNTDDFAIWLNNAPANTTAAPYEIILYGLNIETDFDQDNDPLGLLYNSLKGKYVNLDLSNCKGKRIPATSSSSANSRPDRDKIAAITLPSELTAIGAYAFDGCTGLVSVTFQGTITEDNFSSDSAFPGDLREKYLANGIGTYTLEISGVWNQNEQTSDGAFTSIAAFATWLAAQPENTADTAYQVALNVNDGGSLPDESLGSVLGANYNKFVYLDLSGSPITSIGWGFSHNRSLTGVTIPASVTSIGGGAFDYCVSLNAINVDSGNTIYSSEQGVLYNKNKTTLLRYPQRKAGSTFTIPNSVTRIEERAFAVSRGPWEGSFEESELTSVEIPNSVTSIGIWAFEGSGITSVNIPGSVTDIEYGAFSLCRRLTSVTIGNSVPVGNSVTSIGPYAFSNSQSITSVTIGNNVKSIGDNAFLACISLTSITIPNSVTSIEGSAFSNCLSLTSVTIGTSVTSIGGSAFQECTSLTNVTIPNSVTSIGSQAFYKCTSLTSMTIPNSITSIGYFAFHETPWFNYKPDGLVYAGKVAYNYKGIMPTNTSIVILDGTKGIAGQAFYRCSGLTSVTIPDSITSIGLSAFADCISLTSVTIPNSVTSIVEGTFQGCSSLTSVTIGNRVPSIGVYAFQGCSSLTSITIPDNVTSIGEKAFQNCTNLTSVTFQGTITSDYFSGLAFSASNHGGFIGDLRDKYLAWGIGTYTRPSNGNTWTIIPAFFTSVAKFATWLASQPANTPATAYQVALNVNDIGGGAGTSRSLGAVLLANPTKYVNIDLSGNTITTIPDWAFSFVDGDQGSKGCDTLTEITIPSSVTSIGVMAFYYCSSLTAINVDADNGNYSSQNGVLYNKNKTMLLQYPLKKADVSFTIPNSITSIDRYAFGASGLTSVTIPSSVTSIGEMAFYCSSLTAINVDADNGKYSSQDGILYNKDKTMLLKYPLNKADVSFTIPNSVTSIERSAFQGSSNLTSVTIPNSVTKIELYAFYFCNKLASVTIPDSITRIEAGVFFNCHSLTSVTIPNSVTSIDRDAFCTSGLTSVTIPSSVTSIGEGAFSYCNSLAVITVDAGNIAYSSENGILYNKDKTVLHTYPAGKTSVSFIIPNNVNNIGRGAFEGCTSLTDVTIGNNVTSIGYNAFINCIRLTSVMLPDTIISFDSGAFFGDLYAKWIAGGAGGYTTNARVNSCSVWTKQ